MVGISVNEEETLYEVKNIDWTHRKLMKDDGSNRVYRTDLDFT